MSAAEKLKAMHKEGVRFMVPPDLYRDALPQIVAVVEAAEDAADHFIDQSAHDHGWPIELKAALSDLDKALT